jgi:hypothetical protein
MSAGWEQDVQDSLDKAKFYRNCCIALGVALVVAIAVLVVRNSQYVDAQSNYREVQENGTAITAERDALKRNNGVLKAQVKQGGNLLGEASKQLDKCAQMAEAFGQ